MRKLLSLWGLLGSLSLWGQNVVFNPGFDMTPWDTGWTIEIDTSATGNANVSVFVGPDSGYSLPNCCSLKTYTCAWNGGNSDAKAVIYQTFDEVQDVEFKAYVKYYLWDFVAQCGIQLRVNSEWDTVWEEKIVYGQIDSSNWYQISGSVSDTVSGIKIYAHSSAYSSCCGVVGNVWFWIDDIYVSEIGIEESSKSRMRSAKLEVYPNPFMEYAGIRLPSNRVEVRIYDMMGRLIERTREKVIGENLTQGFYFVRSKGYKPEKIIKIGR